MTQDTAIVTMEGE